jgi:transcription antitermination factor NusG
MTWFAIRTKPQKERITARDLDRRAIEVFYPHVRVRRNRKKRGVTIVEWVERPYYPRYLFANTCRDNIRIINGMASVTRVVSFGDEEPIPIPDALMALLAAGARKGGLMGARDEVARKRFQAAESVRFDPGSPLARLVGKVVEDDGSLDVKVLLQIMGSEREVTAPATALRRIAA